LAKRFVHITPMGKRDISSKLHIERQTSTYTHHLCISIYEQYGSHIYGFSERSSAYTNCLMVLTELKFPDGQTRLELPKGWKQRDIHGNDPK